MVEKDKQITVMKDLRGYFKASQLIKIYSTAETDRDRLLIHLLMVTGRRVTELLGRKEFTHKYKVKGEVRTKDYPSVEGLKPKHIDFDDGLIMFNILKKKTLFQKLKKIDKKTLEMLHNYIIKYGVGEDDHIFNIGRVRAYQIVRGICERAGVLMVGEKFPHPHHFRHTYAINRIRKQNTIEGLMSLKNHLEHSSLNITEQYLQFGQDAEGEIAEELFKDVTK